MYGFYKQTPTTFNAYISPPEAPIFKNKDKSRVARNSIVRSHKGEMIEVPNGIAKRQAIKVEKLGRETYSGNGGIHVPPYPTILREYRYALLPIQ